MDEKKDIAQEKEQAEVAAEAVAAEELSLEEQVEQLRQQVKEAEARAAEKHEQWLRSVAELRNYKKRVEQEREQITRLANAELIGRLLPVLDDLERAMAVLPNEKVRKLTWVEGIVLIFQRLRALLEQHGLQEIEAQGKPFDPYVHEAILFEEVPMEQDQVVLQELQKGYKLHDRVLRPTLVKVGRGVPQEPPSEEPEAETPSKEPEATVETTA